LEQLLIDVEVFKMNRRAYQGIESGAEKYLDEVIKRVGAGGYFMGERSTIKNLRSGEWYLSDFGWHDSYEAWVSAGNPTLLDQARQQVKDILANHEPLPLDESIERELDYIQKRARESTQNGD
jgi:trimethylamine--corrinoid protein Co-methyltransferase